MRWEDVRKRCQIDIPEDEPMFPVTKVCQLVHLQYYTVHEVIKEGIIKFPKSKKNKKLLSVNDMKILKYVKYLMDERGVNVKGIKVILEMEHRI